MEFKTLLEFNNNQIHPPIDLRQPCGLYTEHAQNTSMSTATVVNSLAGWSLLFLSLLTIVWLRVIKNNNNN